MAIDKSGWNPKVKVSQATIDEIKKMGMAKALKTVAGASKASGTDASAKAWVEGVKRLYGANRVAAVVKNTPTKSSSSSSSPASSYRGTPSSTKSTPTPKPKTSTTKYPDYSGYGRGAVANPAASAKSKPKPAPKVAKPNKSALTASDAAAIAKAKSDWLAGKRTATPSKKSPSKPKAKVSSFAPTRQY